MDEMSLDNVTYPWNGQPGGTEYERVGKDEECRGTAVLCGFVWVVLQQTCEGTSQDQRDALAYGTPVQPYTSSPSIYGHDSHESAEQDAQSS